MEENVGKVRRRSSFTNEWESHLKGTAQKLSFNRAQQITVDCKSGNTEVTGDVLLEREGCKPGSTEEVRRQCLKQTSEPKPAQPSHARSEYRENGMWKKEVILVRVNMRHQPRAQVCMGNDHLKQPQSGT